MSSAEPTECDVANGPCDPCKRIQEIDTRIFEVEKLLVSVKAERATLETSRNGLHDRLVGKLPLEIVIQIFQSYVDTHIKSDSWPFLPHRMEDAPLRLGAVCRTWRDIAWTSPQLWTRMSVDADRAGEEFISELAMQWLERTGQLPLSISLYGFWDNSETRDLINIFVKYSARWQTLDISIPRATNIFDKDPPIQNWNPDNERRESLLQHLRLENLRPEFMVRFFRNIRHSPTWLSLFEIEVDRLDIAWDNVTTIAAHAITLEQSFQLLQSARRLQTFSLYKIIVYMASDTFPTPIVHATLRSLTLHHYTTSHFLDRLALPRLEKILCDWKWSDAEGSIVSLIARSRCQIKSLEFRGRPIADGLYRILQETSSVRTLSFEWIDGGMHAEHLFNLLANATSNGQGFLVHLRKLQLVIDLDRQFSWEVIPDIFDPHRLYAGQISASAITHGLQRQSLKLRLWMRGDLARDGYIDTISLRRILNLVEQGINVSISFRDGHTTTKYSHPDFIKDSLAFHHCNMIESGTSHRID